MLMMSGTNFRKARRNCTMAQSQNGTNTYGRKNYLSIKKKPISRRRKPSAVKLN
jgi:hypothetical protein